MLKNLSLIYNEKKDSAIKIAEIIKDTAASENVELVCGDILEHTELVISVGGDGTVLRTARLANTYDIPVAHINVGTLGFLGYETKDVQGYVRTLINNVFEIEERVMLEAHVGDEKFVALNDIVIRNGNTVRVIDLELFLDNKKVYNIKGDGLIISTPTGSTAYSLAAGGPVVMPNLALIIITPLNPHLLTTRPLIVEDIDVQVKCLCSGEEIILTVDGQVSSRLSPPADINIRICKKKFKLVKSKENFFDLLSRKMNWGMRE
jgi:NAD+ kinase